MIASLYKELTQYEEVGGDMWERIKQLGVHEVFEPMYKYYTEKHMDEFNMGLFYILHTYSLESKFHVLKVDWMGIKDRVALKVKILKESPFIERTEIVKDVPTVRQVFLYNDLVLLQEPDIVKTVQRYLQYQGHKNYKHLCMLKDLYEQMVSGALDPIRKGTGEIDFKQKFDNSVYAKQLLAEINEFEQKVSESDRDLKNANDELAKLKSSQQSLRIEDNLKKNGLS